MPRVCTVVYTRGVHSPVCLPTVLYIGVHSPACLPTVLYMVVYSPVCLPTVLYMRVYSPVYPPYHPGIYTTLGIPPPYTPWVHHPPTLACWCTPLHRLGAGEQGPGLNLGNNPGYEAQEGLLLLRVCEKVWSSAQSPSALPVRKRERLDRRRVSLRV